MSARRVWTLACVAIDVSVSACTAQGDRHTLYRDSVLNQTA